MLIFVSIIFCDI